MGSHLGSELVVLGLPRQCSNNTNNILIYKAQLHKSAQSAVQLLHE